MELNSIKVKGKDRVYNITLNSNNQKQRFLTINVSKGERSKEIIIIEDDFSDFLKALNKITEEKAYDVGAIRQKHKKAYIKWTNEDDEKLELFYCEKKTIKEIAEILGRQQNAIKARIKKLELKQKYE